EETPLFESGPEGLGVGVDDDRLQRSLQHLHLLGREALHQPEVEEGHPSSWSEQVVAGVGVAVEGVQPVQAADHVPDDGVGGPVSRPGTMRPRPLKKSPAFSRSALMASSTPGYCTVTATAWCSRVMARCTWPMDAAAIGTGSHSSNRRSGGCPSSASITSAARAPLMGGAFCWSWLKARR